MFKTVNKVRGAFRSGASQLGAFVDPWSYKRADAAEKEDMDKGLQALRDIAAAYKGTEETGEATAEPAPDAANANEPGMIENFHKSQVLKHVDKFIAKVEAYKAGTGTMDMPVGMVNQSLRAMTEEVTNLHNGLGKLVVPVVIPDHVSTMLSDKISSGLTGLTAAMQRGAEALKKSNQKP